MLTITRQQNDQVLIFIPDDVHPQYVVEHTTARLEGNKVRQGYAVYRVQDDGSWTPAKDVPVYRQELWRQMLRDRQRA